MARLRRDSLTVIILFISISSFWIFTSKKIAVREPDLRDKINAVEPKVEITETTRAAIALPTTSPTFEYKCRHRHSKYNSSSGQSHRLQSLLKRYNRLHDKLLKQGPIQMANSIPLTSRNNTIRYIYLQHKETELSVQSISTQIYSLLSAFLLALITDRVLLAENQLYQQVMCEPFTRSSWLHHFKHTEHESLERVLSHRQPTRSLRIDLREESHKSALQCQGNLKDTFGHVQWLVIDDDAGPFIHLMFANTDHDQNLWSLFPDGSVLQPLYSAIIHPSNDIWQSMPDLLKAFSDSSFEKPFKVAYFDQSLRSDAEDMVLRVAAAHLERPDQVLTVFHAPSNTSSLSLAESIFTPPRVQLAASAAHYSADHAVDIYGRFFTDLYLSRHSDLLIFDESLSLGWLAHAIRNKNAHLIQNGVLTEVPALDFKPMREANCVI